MGCACGLPPPPPKPRKLIIERIIFLVTTGVALIAMVVLPGFYDVK